MGRICVVEACGSEYYPDCGLSFHRFPKDPNVREIWIIWLQSKPPLVWTIAATQSEATTSTCRQVPLRRATRPRGITSAWSVCFVSTKIISETVILGIDSLILGFCVKQLSKCKHILNSLHTAPVLDIDATLNKEINKFPNDIIPFVVVRGLVKPIGTPITSNYNSSVTGVIQRLTIKEHVIARTSAGFWSDQTRIIHEVCNSTPFVLNNGKFNIEVVDALSAELLDLDVISDKFEPMSPGVIDHVWGFFSGVRQRGLQTTEEMLRDGSYITAIGELSKSNTGELKIQPPKGLPLYLTTASKSSLLKRLASSRDFFRIMLIVFGTVAAIASGRIAYKYLKRKRRRDMEETVKKQLALGRRERRANAREKNLAEVQLCVVCTENPKEVILLPCGHVCLCEDCSDHISDNCPVCREKIENKAPAFIT